MTTAQIKKSLATISDDDRLYLLHYLKHQLRADTAANARELTKRHEEMRGGRKVTLAQVKRLDAALRREGI